MALLSKGRLSAQSIGGPYVGLERQAAPAASGACEHQANTGERHADELSRLQRKGFRSQ